MEKCVSVAYKSLLFLHEIWLACARAYASELYLARVRVSLLEYSKLLSKYMRAQSIYVFLIHGKCSVCLGYGSPEPMQMNRNLNSRMKANLHDRKCCANLCNFNANRQPREWKGEREREREFNEMFGGGEQWANMCVYGMPCIESGSKVVNLYVMWVCTMVAWIVPISRRTLSGQMECVKVVCEQGYYMLTERSG